MNQCGAGSVRGIADQDLIDLLLIHRTQTATATAMGVTVGTISALIKRRGLEQEIFDAALAMHIRPPIAYQRLLPLGTALCPNCLHILPIAQFKRANKPNGHDSWCRKCMYETHGRSRQKKRYHALRRQVYAAYGDQCFNCGERAEELLTIEHKRGSVDRFARTRGRPKLRDIIAAGYPDTLGLLCWNCNCSKGRTGKLPDRTLYWCRIDPEGPGLSAPQRTGDAGYDLAAATEITLGPGEQADVPTNVRISMPTTHYGEVRARSSLARLGLQTEAGLVDSCYTGHLLVLIRNLNVVHHVAEADAMGRITLPMGSRIGQLVLHRRENFVATEVDDVFDDPRRGNAGFGSTGGLGPVCS